MAEDIFLLISSICFVHERCSSINRPSDLASSNSYPTKEEFSSGSAKFRSISFIIFLYISPIGFQI